MLTDADRLLIAASLDGPLPPNEQDRVRLLLDKSRDARRLDEALRRDREALGDWPVVKAPDTILPSVLAEIESWQAKGMRSEVAVRSSGHSRSRLAVVRYALAASVAITAGLAVIYGVNLNRRHAVVVEQTQALPAEDDVEPLEMSPELVSRIPPIEVPPPVIVAIETAPTPRPAMEPREVYGAPFVPPAVLETVLVRLPMLVAMKDLARDDVQKQLRIELRKDAAHIDLFTRDSGKAVEKLAAAGRASGIQVTIDVAAADRLRRKLPTTWLVYSENLTPEDISAWLQRLAASDAALFQNLHISNPTPHDAKDVKDVLGLDAKTKPTKPKSLTAGTIGEVSSSLLKEKSAILVALSPKGNSTSKDIKSWLDRRMERKPGTVALTLIVR